MWFLGVRIWKAKEDWCFLKGFIGESLRGGSGKERKERVKVKERERRVFDQENQRKMATGPSIPFQSVWCSLGGVMVFRFIIQIHQNQEENEGLRSVDCEKKRKGKTHEKGVG